MIYIIQHLWCSHPHELCCWWMELMIDVWMSGPSCANHSGQQGWSYQSGVLAYSSWLPRQYSPHFTVDAIPRLGGGVKQSRLCWQCPVHAWHCWSPTTAVALFVAGVARCTAWWSVLLWLFLFNIRTGRVGHLALQDGLAALGPGFVHVAQLRRAGAGAALGFILVHGVGVFTMILPGSAGSSCQGVSHYDQQHKYPRGKDAHTGNASLILKHQ